MPDIDPAALSRPAPISTANPSILSLSKVNTVSAVPSQKAAKPASTAQRIDLEPLYTSLKAAIGDKWGKYKEAISLFVLGHLNQNELAFQIDHFITSDPNTEHLHNQLIAGIYGNVTRDPPEPGVAPWVAANDKPTVVSKPVSGDAAEQRLKTEVMQLPARDRRRLKEIPEQRDTYDTSSGSVNEFRAARMIRLPDTVPASAGGLNKTNWDLEIRKRYSQPLASESGEFPDTDCIQNRMMPICYEESLPGGCTSTCAEFMSIATEQFIKQVVGGVLSRTRSNLIAGGAGGHSIMTQKYRKQLLREEAMLEKGQIARGPTNNLLPVEAKEAQGRRPLSIGDFRVALAIGDCSLGQMPHVVSNIMGGWPEGVLEGWDTYNGDSMDESEDTETRQEPRPNGTLTNGVHVNGGSRDDDAWGWEGGGAEDRKKLNELLDQCLAVGR